MDKFFCSHCRTHKSIDFLSDYIQHNTGSGFRTCKFCVEKIKNVSSRSKTKKAQMICKNYTTEKRITNFINSLHDDCQNTNLWTDYNE